MCKLYYPGNPYEQWGQTDEVDLMNGAFSATTPPNPALQKAIVEEQRLHATLPALGDVAWKALAKTHSQRAY